MPSLWTRTLKHLLCLLALGGSLFAETPIQQKLNLIPAHEQFILERFFQILVTTDGLGYTLFGSKPMCLSAYFESVPLGNRLRGCPSDSIKKGWETWQKYEKYFPHPRYLIFKEKETIDGTFIHTIYILDKAKIISTINQHASLFQNELHLHAQNISSSIEQNCSLAILKGHEGLIGILLGYGTESAMKYHQRNLHWKSGLPILFEELQPTSELQPYLIPPLIQPIQFVGNLQSPEVLSILTRNQKERELLLNIYAQGNFLEITLGQLMQH